MANEWVPSTPKRSCFHTAQSPACTNKLERPLYHSPRCEKSDEHLLVAPPESLKTHEDRWHHMSQQAGSHQQDESVLNVTRRISPQALRSGVPPQVAARVRVLRLVVHEKDSLPEWLDVISGIFFELEHLYLSKMSCDNTDIARMRRLYVLYRLPDLKSIDGKDVTELERQLARPSSPNGHRVKRKEWVSFDSSTFDSVDSNDTDDPQGDAIEVSLTGVVKRTHADIPSEEAEWECPLKSSQDRSGSETGSEACDSADCCFAVDSATCGGLSLQAFGNASPVEQVDDSGFSTPLRSSTEDMYTIPNTKSVNILSSAESTPEGLIAEAACSARSLSFTSPFPLVFRGDGTLEEIMERNKPVTMASVTRKEKETFDANAIPSNVGASHPRKVTHARALSSPFPMQFRKKSDLTVPDQQTLSTPFIHSPQTNEGENSDCEEENEEASSVETSLQKNMIPSPYPANAVVPLPSYSTLSSSLQSAGRPDVVVKRSSIDKKTPVRGDGSRPPTCPASRRSIEIHRLKKGKRFACWRPRKHARSKSIVDDDEDESSTDDDNETELSIAV